MSTDAGSALERLVTELSTRFTGLPLDRIDEEIQRGLRLLVAEHEKAMVLRTGIKSNLTVPANCASSCSARVPPDFTFETALAQTHQTPETCLISGVLAGCGGPQPSKPNRLTFEVEIM